jgi:hypothetical protein
LKNTEAFLFKKKQAKRDHKSRTFAYMETKDLYSIQILDNAYISSYFDMFDGLMGAKRDQL